MNFDELGALLRDRVEGFVETNHPLARLTTYRLGGAAALYFEPHSDSDLRALADLLRELGSERVPVLALGRGSNLVVSDAGWPGVVLRMGQAFSWIEPMGEAGLEAGASTSLPLLANWAARRGLAGLEFAVAIPGSVGGAVRMNAGAHGGSIEDCLDSARIFELDELDLVRCNASELGFQYRRSDLTENEIVIDARFSLKADDPSAIKARMDSYRRHRAATQPGAVQNAGSVFKNPPGDSAGRLVEAAGLKGFRVGGAAVSELHANFFVAERGATAQDVHDLVKAVKEKVLASSGVELEEEIRFVGAFGSEDGRHEKAD